MTTVTRIIACLNSGSSAPLLVEASDGLKYLIKSPSSGNGSKDTIFDYILTELASTVGLYTKNKKILWYNSPVICEGITDEQQDMLVALKNKNVIGTVFLGNCKTDIKDISSTVSAEYRETAFLFDIFILNIDRYDTNPNILQHNDRLYIYDFGASILLDSFVEKYNPSLERFVPYFTRSPFYMSIDENCHKRFTDKINSLDFYENTGEHLLQIGRISSDLQIDIIKLINDLQDYSRNPVFLKQTVDLLKNLKPFSQEERQREIKQNRDNFLEKYKLTRNNLTGKKEIHE